VRNSSLFGKGRKQNPSDTLLDELRSSGIQDEHVLAAMRRVPRERFVPQDMEGSSYENRPLPIGFDQTISQPYIVALMTAELHLTGGERVLEIGTGSGYQTAILAELCQAVFSVERVPELATRAQETLAAMGYTNVEFHVGDGSLGWPEHAPYDAIIVTAASPQAPSSLLGQLAEGGRLVIPVGERGAQTLRTYQRIGDETVDRFVCGCRFVPLIGAEGFANA
jgi:protein-L-isoaspartate(D-aspartate) O-methyltransferase